MNEEEYYNIELPIQGIKMIHKSLSFHYEKWPGGHPDEQEDIKMMRDNFYKIILDYQFNNL
jgi:hypothetical protein